MSLRRGRAGGGRRRIAVAALLVLAGCGPDPEQARLCERLIPAFEADPAAVERVAAAVDPDDPAAVVVTYAVRGDRNAAVHRIRCRFAGEDFATDRLRLVAVASDRSGPLSEIRLHMLRLWLGMFTARDGARGDTAAAPAAMPGHVYVAQQTLNAIVLCCVYGLLAVGFALVYDIVSTINLAFGAKAVIGMYVTALAAVLIGVAGPAPLAVVLLSIVAAAAAVGALHGWATERLVLHRLRGGAPYVPLVATLGLAIFLEEYVRLLQGTRDRWLQPVLSGRVAVLADGPFAATVSVSQLAVLGLTAAVYALLLGVLGRSTYGRCRRACADDPEMAALLGVDVGRVVAVTFALGGALAGIAGAVVTLHYGVATFHAGLVLALKALTAAVLGGLGSVAGAMLGGAAVGVFETYWSAWIGAAYKDIAVFALLAAVLIYRPQGLLGARRARIGPFVRPDQRG